MVRVVTLLIFCIDQYGKVFWTLQTIENFKMALYLFISMRLTKSEEKQMAQQTRYEKPI